MARFKQHRQAGYDELMSRGFVHVEAMEFSKLLRRNPTIRWMMKSREKQLKSFDNRFARKVYSGVWSADERYQRFKDYLFGWYKRHGFLSQGKAKGKQPRLRKNAPNPWVWYRAVEPHVPDKRYRSPWEVTQVKRGKTKFDRGQIFIQKAEKGAQKSAIQGWIDQLTKSIRLYPAQRAQFVKQRASLRRML